MTTGGVERILVVNPLGTALSHYQRGIVAALLHHTMSHVTIAFDEPSMNGQHRFRWLAQYIGALRRARTERYTSTLVLWPVLGYLDLVLFRVLRLPNPCLVIHDPTPLVRAVGYGRIAKNLASFFADSRVVTHSSSAREEIARAIGPDRAAIVPHPVAPNADRSPAPRGAVVRVLGQYKASRDLAVLENIASSPALSEYTFEVVGRGWPAVKGWKVRPEFVPESELDNLLRSSAAIVVPYKRFYQSGIAVRALENLTPVVGPRGTSLEDIYGQEAPNLAGDDWVQATRYAVHQRADELTIARNVYRERSLSDAPLYWRAATMRPATRPTTSNERPADD